MASKKYIKNGLCDDILNVRTVRGDRCRSTVTEITVDVQEPPENLK